MPRLWSKHPRFPAVQIRGQELPSLCLHMHLSNVRSSRNINLIGMLEVSV